MSESTRPPGRPELPDDPDDPVALLIKLAGPRPGVPDERAARVRAAVHSRWRRAVGQDRRRSVSALIAAQLAAAAVLAILIKTGFWLRQRIRAEGAPSGTVIRRVGHVVISDVPDAGTGGILMAGTGLTTGADGRVALRLRGGSSVRLDVDTDLRVSSARTLDLRHGAVYIDTSAALRGEAGPGTDGASGAAPTEADVREVEPVEVVTPLGRVSDIGTRFEVRLAADTLDVGVRDGAAVLARGHRDYTVRAGTRLRVGALGAVETVSIPIRRDDWEWILAIAPPFELEGRTLHEYLDWLSRETGWKMEYADPAIAASTATVILHGSTSGMRPDETPGAVLPACGLVHRLEGDRLIIERAHGKAGTG
jgi:ferric-dicitrate binding protein FerR (iron transport regulator)